MRRRGLRGRRRAPTEIIRWGERGIKDIIYTGELPQDFRGRYTSMLYAYNERRKTLGIDARDVPGLIEDAGRDNLLVLQDDGTFAPILKPKPRPKDAEKPDEVSDGD